MTGDSALPQDIGYAADVAADGVHWRIGPQAYWYWGPFGLLGEYALYFGNGYLIHGTLYERYLRRSVSHGCIRVGRDDLREVYRVAPIGTPIYIY